MSTKTGSELTGAHKISKGQQTSKSPIKSRLYGMKQGVTDVRKPKFHSKPKAKRNLDLVKGHWEGSMTTGTAVQHNIYYYFNKTYH